MSNAILCRWNGETMTPAGPYWAKQADKEWVVGERYFVEIQHERSEATHRHEFAWLREAWANLPEHLADQFPTPEHLRKRALVDAGYFDEEIIDAGSNAAALRVRTYLRGKDDFALVVVRGSLVAVRTAKSQSRRAMDAKTFAASKTAVLETVAALIGTSPETLMRNAGAAA